MAHDEAIAGKSADADKMHHIASEFANRTSKRISYAACMSHETSVEMVAADIDDPHGPEKHSTTEHEGRVGILAKLWKCLRDLCLAQVILLQILCMGWFLLQDISFNGLGTANGKYISFADSVNSCASFRNFKPPRRKTMNAGVLRKVRSERFQGRTQSLYWIRAPKSSWFTSISVVSLAFVAKFGSQSLGSVMLGQTPTILQGPRHMISFLIAFALVQLSPGDFIFTSLHESAVIKILLRIACAFYKMRKFNFIIGARADFSMLFTIVVQLVTIDGNTLFQNIELSLFTNKFPKLTDLACIRSHISKPAYTFFVRRSLPLASLTWIALTICSSSLPSTYMIIMRVVVLLFFLYRYDVHNLLKTTWNDWQAHEVREELIGVARKVSQSLRMLFAIVSRKPFDGEWLEEEEDSEDSSDADKLD